jgi:hypothetical protein
VTRRGCRNYTLFSTDGKGLKYLPESNRAACAAFNVHLRGGVGYCDKKTGEKVIAFIKAGFSSAVDAGDPKSDYSKEPDTADGWHGKRVNSGVYGNTPWATMSASSGLFIIVR